MYYVYIHKDKQIGEVVYVGKGSNYRYCNWNSRSDEHATMMKEGKLDLIILKHFDDELEAYNNEGKITEQYKKIGQCKFNISIGRRTSEETKAKLSKVLTGKKRSKETKERIKKNHARPQARKVLMYKDGILIKRFRSSREAGRFASNSGICSYGWVGRSLKAGEYTKKMKNFLIRGYRFDYQDAKIKLRKDQ